MPDRFQAALGARRGHADPAAVRVPEHDKLISQVISNSEHIPGIFSNPGIGNVRVYGDSVTFRDAASNILALIADVGSGLHLVSGYEDADESGRYAFVLARQDKAEVAVEMPGLPLELIRYEQDKASALMFPRLYVDGSSRWWPFAISELREFVADEDY